MLCKFRINNSKGLLENNVSILCTFSKTFTEIS